MTNDIFLKGFWPPEAKMTVDLGRNSRLNFIQIYAIYYDELLSDKSSKN